MVTKCKFPFLAYHLPKPIVHRVSPLGDALLFVLAHSYMEVHYRLQTWHLPCLHSFLLFLPTLSLTCWLIAVFPHRRMCSYPLPVSARFPFSWSARLSLTLLDDSMSAADLHLDDSYLNSFPFMRPVNIASDEPSTGAFKGLVHRSAPIESYYLVYGRLRFSYVSLLSLSH